MAAGSAPGQPTIRRLRNVEPIEDLPATVAPPVGGSSATPAPDDGELFERIVDALEERVIAELERRGRRHFPGVL